MGIQGKARENTDFSRQTGLFEGEVIAVNPNKENLEKLLGTEIEKEPEYTSEDEKNKKKATVVFWIKDVKTGKLKSLRFYLKDVERTNKDNTKRQYITDLGDTSWTDDEANLPDWFKTRSYRIAKEGEENFYKFAVTWLSKLDRKDPDTTLVFDWKALMGGNVKEISNQIKSDFDETVVLLNTLRVVDKEGEKKEYEQVYNQAFLPGYIMKYVKTTKIDKTFIESAKTLDRKKRSKLQAFVLEVTDSQYGVKDYYTLGELEDYDASKNPAASDKVINDDDTGY